MYEFCKIYDAKTNELLTSGLIIKRKSHNPKFLHLKLISTDGKWFFNMDSPLFRTEIEKSTDEKYMDTTFFTKENDYPWVYWREWDTPEPMALYRDYSYEEIDEEVKPLVYELNRWKGIRTIGSCSGHGKNYAWVQFYSTDANVLNHFLNIIRSPLIFPDMLDKFTFEFSSEQSGAMTCFEGVFGNNAEMRTAGVFLFFKTIAIGEQAYEDIRKLSRYMAEVRELIGITENKDERIW